MNNLLFSLKGEALKLEKRKDYRNLVILQILIIFSALLLKDILILFGITESFVLRDSLFLLLGGLYVIFLWDMMRNFTSNKAFLKIILALILFGYFLGLVTVNPFYKVFEGESQRPYLLIVHAILFLVELIVILFAIPDLFTGAKDSKDRLWGAASVYLMIAIAFGSLYDLISIIKPGSMGVPLQLGLESYTECIYYSMTILGGQDPLYDNPSRLIRNIGIVEALWGSMFIVLLVGRLLSKNND